MTEHKHGFLVAGLPGAGKSTVCEMGAEMTGGEVLESGTIIRQHADEEGVDTDSESLGNFAARQRSQRGPAFVAEELVGHLLRDDIDVDYPLFIAGVRHRDEITEYNQFFDSTTTLWVDASPNTRVERIRERGRDGEDDFDLLDLLNRDSRELEELGVATLVEGQQEPIDRAIPNEGTEEQLRRTVERIVLRVTDDGV